MLYAQAVDCTKMLMTAQMKEECVKNKKMNHVNYWDHVFYIFAYVML